MVFIRHPLVDTWVVSTFGCCGRVSPLPLVGTWLWNQGRGVTVAVFRGRCPISRPHRPCRGSDFSSSSPHWSLLALWVQPSGAGVKCVPLVSGCVSSLPDSLRVLPPLVAICAHSSPAAVAAGHVPPTSSAGCGLETGEGCSIGQRSP